MLGSALVVLAYIPLAGLILGIIQSRALAPWIGRRRDWVIATAAGLTLGMWLSIVLGVLGGNGSDYYSPLIRLPFILTGSDWALWPEDGGPMLLIRSMMLVGIAVGIAQSFVLRTIVPRGRATAWVVFSTGAWSLGQEVASMISRAVTGTLGLWTLGPSVSMDVLSLLASLLARGLFGIALGVVGGLALHLLLPASSADSSTASVFLGR